MIAGMTGMPGTPVAPPTMPDPNATGRRALAWPTVIGVIAIVFGVGGLLGSIGGVVWQALLLAGNLEAWGVQDADGAEAYAVPGLVLQAVAVLIPGALLVGGVLLVRRRRAAVRWLVTWAIVKLLHGAAAVVMGYLVQQAMLASMGAGPAGPSRAFVNGVMLASFTVTAVWITALPVFVLLWFTRPRVRADVARAFEPAGEAGGA